MTSSHYARHLYEPSFHAWESDNPWGECAQCGERENDDVHDRLGRTGREQVTTDLRCLDKSDACQGSVEHRFALSASGRSFPRCDHHWQLRLDEQERIDRTYGPSSSVAPAWFDEGDAGERWDDDY